MELTPREVIFLATEIAEHLAKGLRSRLTPDWVLTKAQNREALDDLTRINELLHQLDK